MAKKNEPHTTWEQIGTFAWTPASSSIGDPCRLVRLEYGEMSSGHEPFRQIEQPAHGRAGDKILQTVVTLRTGIGDGDYPVWAIIEDGMVKTVVIEFLSDNLVKAMRKHMAQEQPHQCASKGTCK